MFFRFTGFPAFLAAMLAFGSCSVKEDRSDCPCRLTVEAGKGTVLSAWYGGQKILDNHSGGIVDRMVPRGIVEIVASEGRFCAEVGQQVDSLFAEHALVDTDGETAGHSVNLQKSFATIGLDFKDKEEGRIDYVLLVTGTVSGVDCRTLEPVDGLFRCSPEVLEDGRGYRFRVPRQRDDSLTLVLSEKGETVDTIPLGVLIRKTGFDWTQGSLGDVAVVADLPASTFEVTVMAWDGPVTMTVMI